MKIISLRQPIKKFQYLFQAAILGTSEAHLEGISNQSNWLSNHTKVLGKNFLLKWN